MKITLIYPPITDPTAPYHSLSYLAAYVRDRTVHSVDIVDANIEALLYCARPAEVSRLLHAARHIEHAGEAALQWSCGITPDAPAAAISVMRDPERFYDYESYYLAAQTLRQWIRLLSVRGMPGQFGDFSLEELAASDGRDRIRWCNLQTLVRDETLNPVGEMFRDYIDNELLPRLEASGTTAVGISITYHDQLPFALRIARDVRRALPSIKLVLGGTDVSQMWKYSQSTNAYRYLLTIADALVVGEGESAVAALLDRWDGGDAPLPPNIITPATVAAGVRTVAVYENVNDLPTPVYTDLPWHKYLSPERMVCYSPSRGCYWDKCTFCDYGLATDRPTSPWRERSVEAVVNDLRKISQVAPFIYFSVDVLPPRFLVKLAERIIDEGISIRWGAELRLEKSFDVDTCALLKRSGCVAISVGFESGNQRILDLMKKGTRVERTREVVSNFASTGVAVQVMGFTEFPTETAAEACESIAMLQELRDQWVFGGLGSFKLTAGAIVARSPAAFGLASVSPRIGDDVHCFLEYTEIVPSKTDDERRSIETLSASLQHPFELPRPFVGGTDTAHSYFYMSKFGRDTRRELDRAIGEHTPEARLALRGSFGADGTTITIEDGRTIAGTALLQELVPLLRGDMTYDEIASESYARWGTKAFLYLTHLRQAIDGGWIRFLSSSS